MAHITHIRKEDRLLYDSYFAFGIEEVKRLKFNRKILRNKLFDNRIGDQKNHMRMMDEIINVFPITSRPYYIEEIEEKLNLIYKQFTFERKAGKLAKASATDIEEYFDCKRINGKKKIDGVYKTYYKLFSSKYKLSEEAKLLR